MKSEDLRKLSDEELESQLEEASKAGHKALAVYGENHRLQEAIFDEKLRRERERSPREPHEAQVDEKLVLSGSYNGTDVRIFYSQARDQNPGGHGWPGRGLRIHYKRHARGDTGQEPTVPEVLAAVAYGVLPRPERE